MKKILFFQMLLLVFFVSCTGTESSDEIIQTAIAQTQTAEEPKRISTPTPNIRATQARATRSAEDLEATQQASSSSAVARATAQARAVFDHVMRLMEEGYLENDKGNAYVLEDFKDSWAQLGWYQWTYSGRSPSEFILRADVSWDSASDKANWFESGCGFVFGERDQDNHFLAWMGLDGWVHLNETRNGNWIDLGYAYAGSVDTPSGEANLMLVVADKKIHFFIDDNLIKSRQLNDDISGDLAFTIFSGTNKGFGTRCDMENIKLWEIGRTDFPIFDDFSDDESGWAIGVSEHGGWTDYMGGVYSVISPGDEMAMVGLAKQNFVNIEFEVEGMPVSDIPGNEYTYGVACRVQPNMDGYYMELDGEGGYIIRKWEGDDFVDIAEGRKPSTLNTGMMPNKLKAVCDGEYLAFYVNDELLAEGSDDTFFYGDVGLHATSYFDSEFEVHFDNASIKEVTH